MTLTNSPFLSWFDLLSLHSFTILAADEPEVDLYSVVCVEVATADGGSVMDKESTTKGFELVLSIFIDECQDHVKTLDNVLLEGRVQVILSIPFKASQLLTEKWNSPTKLELQAYVKSLSWVSKDTVQPILNVVEKIDNIVWLFPWIEECDKRRYKDVI